MDSRIAILGANGTGKSTLLNLIIGNLQPVKGTVSKHSNLKLAKYSQHSADQLPYDKSPVEYFQSLFAESHPDKDLMVGRLWCEILLLANGKILSSSGGLSLAALVLVALIKRLLFDSCPMAFAIGNQRAMLFSMLLNRFLSELSFLNCPWNIPIFSCSVRI